jgi:hypothetical protein
MSTNIEGKVRCHAVRASEAIGRYRRADLWAH